MSSFAHDVLAIQNLIARFAQAVDDRDEAACRDCLADTVLVGSDAEGPVGVPARLYAHDGIARASDANWTHHKMFNAVIDLHPDGMAATGRLDVVVELSRFDHKGCRRCETIGSRCHIDFTRQDGDWRIARRVMRQRYIESRSG